MKKRTINLILILLIIIIVLIPIVSFEFTGYITKQLQKQVRFYFYDENTNCSLNGYVFTGEKLIGKSVNGFFNLTYENYLDNIKDKNENISLFGNLGDCFLSDLLFDKYWESFEIEDYYFSGESIFNFKTKITQNNPAKRELIGFIQPTKIKQEMNNININNKNTLDALSSINDYLNDKIEYKKDWDFNKETNYWQTPLETLQIKQGDCEDFSTILLSLFLAYNNSLNCYNIVFTSHVTTFCHVEDYYIYYDQEKTELKKEINNKINTEQIKSQLIKLKQEYFGHYGINTTNETESKVHYAFNDNQYIEFKNEDDFINWQYSLENKKQEFDLFEELENQTDEIEKKYPAEEIELATRNVELPTLRGFAAQNSILLVSLSFILIILLAILIKINKK